ncbi:MAG: putative hydrophobic protein (TIGR00271 family) [Crocinitomicaceae bacterium]|jgi:uncharacterized hydrophobic protein (TIGR00271 family)
MNAHKLLNTVMRTLRLDREVEDHAVIHNTIESGVVFKGTNLWILTFAILVASVGLNMNSPAVVIGAMLISPLMGPINGVGYSIATYNFDLLKRSLKNIAFASAAGLVASTIYFLLTPIHTEHSELLARTSPTIYDVLIAVFGGFAGIVAITSKNKGNVIPGVAIATALMPPLCTAGYGLSVANWGYFFGALYLFLINSVFIALSAMVVSQLLKLPKKSTLLSREIKNKNIAIVVVALLTVVPSFYLGVTLVQKEQFKSDADKFVSKVEIWEGNYLMGSKIDADNKKITLVYGGNELEKESISRLREKAKDLSLEEAEIIIKQGLKVNDFSKLNSANEISTQKEQEISRLKVALMMKQESLDSLNKIPTTGQSLLKELRTLFPDLESCSYAPTTMYIDSTNSSLSTAIVYFTARDTISQIDQSRIKHFVETRLKTKDIILKF